MATISTPESEFELDATVLDMASLLTYQSEAQDNGPKQRPSRETTQRRVDCVSRCGSAMTTEQK